MVGNASSSLVVWEMLANRSSITTSSCTESFLLEWRRRRLSDRSSACVAGPVDDERPIMSRERRLRETDMLLGWHMVVVIERGAKKIRELCTCSCAVSGLHFGRGSDSPRLVCSFCLRPWRRNHSLQRQSDPFRGVVLNVQRGY